MKKQTKTRTERSRSIPSGYKPSPFGPIPNDWNIKQLSEFGEVISGLTYSPDDVKENGVLVLRSSNIQDRMLEFTDNVYVSIDKENYNPVKFGDILICVRNGSKSLIGKNAIIDKRAEGMAFGAFMSVFRSKNYNYLYHLFDTDYYRKEIYINLGATINSINGSDLRKFKFPFPPIREQTPIANLLSTWDKAIQTTTQLIEQKQNRKKWLMQMLLTGKKRLKGFEKEKWKEVRLGDLFDERNETGYIDLQLLSVGSEGIYPQSDSVKKDTSNEDKSKYKRICVGDIGYNTMRMWQGRCALSSLEGIISPAYTVVKPNNNTDAKFFAYLFKTPHLINSFYRNSQGLVDDTLNCKYKDFAIVKTFVPPTKKEQEEIAKVLMLADNEIEVLNKKLEQFKYQKKGLMQILLTGKKRLKI